MRTKNMLRIGLICCATAILACRPASAKETYPAHEIHMVTAFGAGSASDIVARLIAERLADSLKQPVIVDNKPGASGQIASDFVSRAAPDGYTIMLATNTTHSANPYLFKSLRYDPIKDFTPLAQVCNFPFVLAVSGKLPVSNVQELIAYAKSKQSQLSYAYGNSTGQVSAAAFDKAAGLKAIAVPYRSSPQAMTDVVGGRASFMFADLASAAGHMQSGNLKALAVTTKTRTSLAPDLPTIAEAVGQPDFDLAAWVGIFGPAGMPQPIVDRLSTEIVNIISTPDFRDRLTRMGAEPTPAPASEFGPFVVRQLSAWGEKVKQAGIEAQ